MFCSAHAIKSFKKNGLFKAAKELGHSKSANTKNSYLKPEDNNLYLNEGKVRYDNSAYHNIFDYLPNNNRQFIKRKRNNSNKKSNKNKVVNKDSFYDEKFSFSETNTISENYSIYDNIFGYGMIPNLNITEKENKSISEPDLTDID